jgi:hypothetical protein
MTRTVPTVSPEQRAAGLEKATIARQTRMKLRNDLKSGNVTLPEVLKLSDMDDIIAKTRVLYILESLPKIGKARAQEILKSVGIAEVRRLGGLGDRQRKELIERVS